MRITNEYRRSAYKGNRCRKPRYARVNRAVAESLESRRLLSGVNIVVMTAGDDGGELSPVLNGGIYYAQTLRDAVNFANSQSSVNISFDPSVFSTPQTINLTNGQLEISNVSGNVTIEGPGESLLTLSGDEASSILYVPQRQTDVSISDVTLTDGNALVSDNTVGGAIIDKGEMTLTDVAVTHSIGNFGGGILQTGGELTVVDSTISGNSAPGGGATAPNNLGVSGQGGGIYAIYAELNISNSTFNGNEAAYSAAAIGGVGGNWMLTNSTFCYNRSYPSSNYGCSAIESSGDLTITDCTIARNATTGSDGDAVDIGGITQSNSNADWVIDGTIIADNTAAGQPTGLYYEGFPNRGLSGGHNLIDSESNITVFTNGDANGDIIGSNADLEPLANNGGPTETMALELNSPAIGAGSMFDIPGTDTPIATDQRGFPRLSSEPDIGAFQSGPLIVSAGASAGAGQLSLLGAIQDAEQLGGSQTISFDSNIFSTPQTITLNAPLTINNNLRLLIEAPTSPLTINGNNATGIFDVTAGSSLSLSDLILDNGNAGAGDGGGILCNGSLSLTNCTISNCQASDGGGLFLNAANASVTLENCIFTGDLASSGGAVFAFNSFFTLTNCLFTDNSASTGSAIADLNGSEDAVNCTFADNIAASDGGAIYGQNSSNAMLVNCILWNDEGSELNFAPGALVLYSDVDEAGFGGSGGNVDANPNFVGSGPAPFALAFPSPCVNTGRNASIVHVGTDLAGAPRVVPAGGNVDMGAYEFQGPFTIYVDQHAHGANNGSSWTNAFTSLQSAFAAAEPGDTIDVAEGDYSPGGLASSTFQLINGVVIQGGFDTGGAAGPDPSLYPTYLDGDKLNNHVVTASGTDNTAVLDGFTIENGNAAADGGGLYASNGAPKVLDCVFTKNVAANNGGAVALENSDAPLLADCIFVNNSAANGGALFQLNVSSSGAVPDVLSCVFRGNSAGNVGGAVDDSGGSPYLLNCTISENTASFGGAIGANVTSAVNCILWNDTSFVSTAYAEIYGSLTATSSDIDGGYQGSGNINTDPQFISATNLQLQNGSACIGSANNTTLYLADEETMVDTDAAGNPRTHYNGPFSLPTADTGAYSYEGPISLLFVQSPPAVVAAGNSFSVIVNLEQNGQLTIGDNSTVTLTIASGPAGATLYGTQAIVDSFEATFSNVSISGPAGVYVLQATDGGDISADSISFNVAAASGGSTPALGLGFIQEPTGVNAGAEMNPAVEIGVYAGGALDVSDHSIVTLSTPGNAIASAQVEDGVAYFDDLVFASPGSLSLTATDGNDTSITSYPFTVSAAPAPTTLVFSAAPSGIAAGEKVTPAITVTEVQNGAVLQGDNSSVVYIYVSQSSSGGIVEGALSAPVVDGVATFSNLQFTEAGGYVLTAYDGNDINANLGINISAPETSLVFTTEPSGGSVIPGPLPTFAVSVEQNGQVVTGDDSTIRVSVLIPFDASYGPDIEVQAINGVAIFSTYDIGELDSPSGIILQATDVTNPGDQAAVSNAINVTEGPPRDFGVNSANGNGGNSYRGNYVGGTATAGVSATQPITFSLYDVDLDSLPLDSTSVTASIFNGPAGAVLAGNLTEPMDVGFSNLQLNLAGSYELQFTDAADNLTAFGKIEITAQPAPTQLAFVQQPSPSSTESIIEPNVSVEVEDQFGNVVTTDSSDQITLSVASPEGDFPEGQVTETVQNGIATFNELYLSAIGTYTLSATGENLTPAVSNSFVVVPPRTIFVDQSAPGSNDGQDWYDAFTNLQSALAVASSGDVIDVAQGDYSPGADPSDAFQLLDGVTLRGGFASGGSSDPDSAEYPTILDGTNANYHVVNASATDSSAVLEGFTIENGNACGDGAFYAYSDDSFYGGGLLIDSGDPTISNCTFIENSAQGGGAVFATNGVSSLFVNCVFNGDTASNANSTIAGGGGAVLTIGASPNFVNCQFSNNASAISGGAVDVESGSPYFTNCLFAGNQGSCGAVYVDGTASPALTNCTFTQNSDAFFFPYTGPSPLITNCILWNDIVEFAGSQSFDVETCCDIGYDGDDGISAAGTGNINIDPQFVDPSDGNFQLQPTSPCINVGDNNAPALAGLTTDLAGDRRIVDNAVDLGAYEAQSVQVTWTAGGDGTSFGDPANWSNDLVPTQYDDVFIPSGATIQLLENAVIAELTMQPGSAIDLGNSTLTIDYGSNPDPMSTIVSYLDSGYNHGAWNGTGIMSSVVEGENESQSKLLYSVGYADGADGITATPAGQIEIMPTLAGDAKLQGNVVFGDFQLLSQYFGKSGTSWDEGNFTYGSATEFGDFQLLSQNFGQTSSLGNGLQAAEIPHGLSRASESQAAVKPAPVPAAVLSAGNSAISTFGMIPDAAEISPATSILNGVYSGLLQFSDVALL